MTRHILPNFYISILSPSHFLFVHSLLSSYMPYFNTQLRWSFPLQSPLDNGNGSRFLSIGIGDGLTNRLLVLFTQSPFLLVFLLFLFSVCFRCYVLYLIVCFVILFFRFMCFYGLRYQRYFFVVFIRLSSLSED